MSRRQKTHKWAEHPDLLTGLIGIPDKLRKVDWNFDKYEDELFKRPCDVEAVTYAAIDFCVAIVSLRDWVKRRVLRDARNDKSPNFPSSDKDFYSTIGSCVRWQGPIEAIANAVKHGGYDDAAWPEGIATPATFVPDHLNVEKESTKDGLELFAFMHRHRDVAWWDLALRTAGSDEATPGYIAFGDALDDWHAIISKWRLK